MLLLALYYIYISFKNEKCVIFKKKFKKNQFFIKADKYSTIFFEDRFKDLFFKSEDIQYHGLTNFNQHMSILPMKSSDEYYLFSRREDSSLTDEEFIEKLSEIINCFRYWILTEDNEIKTFGQGKIFFSEKEAIDAKIATK